MERLTGTVVLDNGDVVEAGTEATDDLKAQIANPVAWEDDGEPDPKPSPRSKKS